MNLYDVKCYMIANSAFANTQDDIDVFLDSCNKSEIKELCEQDWYGLWIKQNKSIFHYIHHLLTKHLEGNGK